jgi:hypothetical protein
LFKELLATNGTLPLSSIYPHSPSGMITISQVPGFTSLTVWERSL